MLATLSHLLMLPQRTRMGVGLSTALDPAGVGLIRGVDMHVLLSVGRVGELPLTIRMGTGKRFLI